VEFDLAAYGGKPYDGSVGDGISFYLIDGSTTTYVGGPGGGLGYARHHPSRKPGVTKGYIGIGIDQWGAFSDPTHAGSGGPGRKKNHVVLRGSGNQHEGFAYLTGAPLPELTLTRQEPARVHLSIIDGKVTVGIYRGAQLQKLIDAYDLGKAPNQAKLPATFKLGLSGSSGRATNLYEVRNLRISLPADPSVELTSPIIEPEPGQTISYQVVARNAGSNPVPDAVLTIELPPQLTNVRLSNPALTDGASVVAGPTVSGTRVTVTVSLPRGAMMTLPITGDVPESTTSETQLATTGEIKSEKTIDTDPSNSSARLLQRVMLRSPQLLPERQRKVISQDEGDRFALDHGAVALHGADKRPAIRHDISGGMVHGTQPGRPLVHMVCWEEEPCAVEVRGKITVAGDPEAPVRVRMQHEFANDHHQTLSIEPVDHTVHLDTALAKPVHHALQMRTPLEVRFCNPWHVASDYRLEINLGQNRVIGVRLTGATVATPQPYEAAGPPVDAERTHP
jgi:uncharacterized repeat protein (TIGR01451 family)